MKTYTVAFRSLELSKEIKNRSREQRVEGKYINSLKREKYYILQLYVFHDACLLFWPNVM